MGGMHVEPDSEAIPVEMHLLLYKMGLVSKKSILELGLSVLRQTDRLSVSLSVDIGI